MSVITLMICGIIALILFGKSDEYMRKGICWMVIAATVVGVILFVMNPHLWVTSIVKP